jgi:hypothetical protein
LIPAAKEDLTKNLEICDMIKSKQVPAKDALRTIKTRFLHHNPNVHILALQVSLSAYLALAYKYMHHECRKTISDRNGE